MYRKTVACVFVLATLMLSAIANADENAVRQAFQGKFPKVAVESVTRTPFGGIYEVVMDGQIFYTDEKASYLFSGSLLDLRAGEPRNLTQEASAKLAATAL